MINWQLIWGILFFDVCNSFDIGISRLIRISAFGLHGDDMDRLGLPHRGCMGWMVFLGISLAMGGPYRCHCGC